MTLVCVPITVVEPHRAAEEAEAAARAGADAVEFRFDGMLEHDVDAGQIEAARRLVKGSPLPVIATCRIASEGGGYAGSDDARAELFSALVASDAPPRWLDVEWAAWSRSASLRAAVAGALREANTREARCTLILSTHDFDGRPPDLLRRLRAMGEEPLAGVHKVAYRARSLRDNLEIAELLRHRERPTIALAMGEFGLTSRVLAPKWGGFLTFAALRSEAVTAPGQPTVDELLGLYRFRSISRTTAVYGVVGWPVAHSMSPGVHNAGFGAAEIDAVYLPLPVPEEWEHFKATVGAMAAEPLLGLRGLSVTAPHKRRLVRLAREEGWSIERRAERTGAANTLALSEEGRGSVHDTDGPAAASMLEESLGGLRGARVMLLGAGGVARSIGAALVEQGAEVVVRARREAQAEELEGELRAMRGGQDPSAGPSPDALRASTSPQGGEVGAVVDAVVNCTPAGMAGGGAEGEAALADEELARLVGMNPSLVVMDTVYRPLETPLLAAARGLGARTLDGATMFVRQAQAQFALWTGSPPEVGLYERLVRARLGGG